jgi:hypothetical protein
MNMNMMLLGVIVALAGVILMILGKLWAVVLFLAGFCLIVAHWAKLYKGAGYEADVSAGNGLYGQGRQQSEACKDPSIPQEYEDRPANQ